MSNRPYIAVLLAALSLLPNAPALADGEILITQAKALAGNVTAGDAAGYPVTITTRGAFELASNLVVPADKIGIQVTSQNVTIDLNGFTMLGSGVAWYGIVGGVDAVTIENGNIRSFKFDGVNGTGNFWIVDKIRSVGNGRDGIIVGQFALVSSSISVFNSARGIRAAFSAVIEGNNVSSNGAVGVDTVRSAVVGNAINSNTGFGILGAGTTGYANNTMVGNDAGTEASNVLAQDHNACQGICP